MHESREKEHLAVRIRKILREKNLRQVAFAKALGISANYVYR